MILGKEGQTFSSDGRVFAVGGTAWCPRERNGELFCTIRAIRAEDNETPTAQRSEEHTSELQSPA